MWQGKWSLPTLLPLPSEMLNHSINIQEKDIWGPIWLEESEGCPKVMKRVECRRKEHTEIGHNLCWSLEKWVREWIWREGVDVMKWRKWKAFYHDIHDQTNEWGVKLGEVNSHSCIIIHGVKWFASSKIPLVFVFGAFCLAFK